MGPLVLIGKGIVLGGWVPSKIEVIWVPGKHAQQAHRISAHTYPRNIHKHFECYTESVFQSPSGLFFGLYNCES